MGYVKIKIKSVESHEDLKRREDRMHEKAECWNKFCLGIYGVHELQAIRVLKDVDDKNIFLTTLCEDCIKNTADYNLLVNESHLMVEPLHNEV